MQTRPQKRLAIVDYDNCSYAPFHRLSVDGVTQDVANKHKLGLSQMLLDAIKEGEFDAFYACTHRVTATSVPSAFDDAKHLAGMRALNPGFNPGYGLTTSITDNLAAATGLECVAVSTPDDFFGATAAVPAVCGKGYTTLIKPFEELLRGYNRFTMANVEDPEDLIEPEIEDELYDFYELDATRAITKNAGGDKTKNQQLAVLIQHAREKFPDHNLEFVFYDDEPNICLNALKLTLSAGVTLEVWQHDACLQTMERRGRVAPANVAQQGLLAPVKNESRQSAEVVEVVPSINKNN